MKKASKLFALAVAGLLALGMLAGCGNGGDKAQAGSLESIKESGKIRIGVFSDKPPFGYVDANGVNQGYDVAVAKRLAKDLLGDENKIEFVLVEAASRVEYLESNKVDVILANFTVTEERKQRVDFADPYMKVALGVVSKEGAITDVEQLKGKKLIVNKGTTAELYFAENHPDIELLKYEQNSEAFQALKDGRGDALAHDNTLLFAWARENDGYAVGVKTLGNLDTIAPAVKKGNTELLNWINEECKSLKQEQFFHQAYEQTLRPAYGDTVDPADVLID